MTGDDFTLENLRDQLRQLMNPGLMTRWLNMLPGMAVIGAFPRDSDANREMTRMLGIIDSMTPQERQTPKIIDRDRRNRIARGAGAPVEEVTQLLRQFDMMTPVLMTMLNRNRP